MSATRERQVRFMRAFGSGVLEKAAEEMLRRRGPDWLTDEQLSEIVSDTVSSWRFSQRINRQNRRFFKRLAR